MFLILLSNNEKSAITSRDTVLCHFYEVLYFVCTVLHCNGNIILGKPLDFMHCVASRFGYPNYRLSELSLVPISSDNRPSTVKQTLRPYHLMYRVGPTVSSAMCFTGQKLINDLYLPNTVTYSSSLVEHITNILCEVSISVPNI